MTALNLFRLIDRASADLCLFKDAVYLPEGKWFAWNRIQSMALDVAAIKANYGDILPLSLHFAGKILLRIGVSIEGHSFVWCGEKTLHSRRFATDICQIDLSRVQQGTLEISLLALEESAVFDKRPVAEPAEINPQQVLYSFLSPTYELCCEEPLYYHFCGEQAYHSFTDGNVYLAKDTSVDLLTYFNSFSAVKWKRYTNVGKMSAYVDFTGKAVADLVHLTEKGSVILASWSLQTEKRTTLLLPLGEYPTNGIMGLRIYGEGPCVLYGGGYLTDAPDTQAVRLGIGITTYRREGAVKAAVARLGKAIAAHPLYHDTIDITVVDNGQTLTPGDVPTANLIPNRNLGGTGGFMRSLIHYQDAGGYTHCLFMDDDASCEAGSIFRSIAFMRHATDRKIAMCGAMLYESIQFLQWENGAWFDSGCHSVNRDFDLRDSKKLLSNESESQKKIYGAWWFFFFPISEVKKYPFPFFVRGDDIDFSYINDFLIITMNGISCWQRDFKSKENPTAVYFFMRSHIVHHLTLSKLRCSYWAILKILRHHFFAYNNSYLYDSAGCVNLAIRHVLKGPTFWEENIIPVNVMKQIQELSSCEKDVPYSEREAQQVIFADKNLKTAKFPILIRKVSLYGHLLPKFMIRSKPLYMIKKEMMPNPNRMYMRHGIVVFDCQENKAVMLKRSPLHFFSNLGKFIGLNITLFFKFKNLRSQYMSAIKRYREQNFWKNYFDN